MSHPIEALENYNINIKDINDINNIYSNKNRSSKNLLNIMQYKNIIYEKKNLDENIQKVDSIDNSEKDIENCEQKLFH